MRHRRSGRKLNRNSAHRKALVKNLVMSLFESENGSIKTTRPKAKMARSLAERLITLGKEHTEHNYKLALKKLQCSASFKYKTLRGRKQDAIDEYRKKKVSEQVKGDEQQIEGRLAAFEIPVERRDKRVLDKLFRTLGPRFRDRNGGYTRIIGFKNRKCDNADMVIWQLVEGEGPAEEPKEGKGKGKKR